MQGRIQLGLSFGGPGTSRGPRASSSEQSPPGYIRNAPQAARQHTSSCSPRDDIANYIAMSHGNSNARVLHCIYYTTRRLKSVKVIDCSMVRKRRVAVSRRECRRHAKKPPGYRLIYDFNLLIYFNDDDGYSIYN